MPIVPYGRSRRDQVTPPLAHTSIVAKSMLSIAPATEQRLQAVRLRSRVGFDAVAFRIFPRLGDLVPQVERDCINNWESAGIPHGKHRWSGIRDLGGLHAMDAIDELCSGLVGRGSGQTGRLIEKDSPMSIVRHLGWGLAVGLL